ncbi:hypothetical protein CEXT_582971 [Caerostris extrusa]|uniref:Uncharacterized protein n=1 Tax=Caerostris extrusa TaxID=172846 RepID=A0AAV4TFY1_CAEEX|nr:hypothetical protein CEXT_582971 [Caerostris extrusa]
MKASPEESFKLSELLERGGGGPVGNNGFECSIAPADSRIPTAWQERGLLEGRGCGGGPGMEIIPHVPVGQLCWVRSFNV